MDSSTVGTVPPATGADQGSPVQDKGRRGLAGSFALVGAVMQRPRQFFGEVRDKVGLGRKIGSLLLASTVFLAIYGAVLGSRNPILALGVAIAAPFLMLASWATCIPVMYLLDVLTGSQRSLGQLIAVLLAAIGAASMVFFSFAPIMVVFGLTGTFPQFFVLNVCIVGLAGLVGLSYMAQGLIQTAVVDSTHTLSHVNRKLHLVWIMLFIMVVVQMAWGLLSFFQRTGGFANLVRQQILLWAR